MSSGRLIEKPDVEFGARFFVGSFILIAAVGLCVISSDYELMKHQLVWSIATVVFAALVGLTLGGLMAGCYPAIYDENGNRVDD